ncbi:hypothetical protein [Helcococcus kunzii]
MLSAIGTIYLGYIAWKQNERLLLIEERSYLSSNAGSALISEIGIKDVNFIACGFHNHVEQIVQTQEVENKPDNHLYKSFSLECKLDLIDNTKHIAFIKVKAIELLSNNSDKNQSLISAKGSDEEYSKVAIFKNYDKIQITLKMSKNEKDKFIKSINDSEATIFIVMKLLLLTDNFVETELTCQATLGNPDYDAKEKIYSNFKTLEDSPARCFVNGISLKNINQIKIKWSN